ncbi:class I SAM-dependent methyltransferase [Paraflavitalea soli]|nr:class I SAM-dependent methyltransferase [Paraflavitalea soli]
MKKLFKLVCPPVLILAGKKAQSLFLKPNSLRYYRPANEDSQELDVYWTDQMANQLEEWGRGHTWNEIECLLVNCSGKVLDIACGTGVNILEMLRFNNLDIYGFDISDFLIKRAIGKGIDPSKLKVADATKTDYLDNEFDFSYSIGSLEHFTEEGIDLFLKEASRYTSKASFHMIPVSESTKDEGWMRTNQSFHNNSVEWWLAKYKKHFREVHVINSAWKDPGLSVGKWFICNK